MRGRWRCVHRIPRRQPVPDDAAWRRLRWVSPFSGFANLCIIAGIAIVLTASGMQIGASAGASAQNGTRSATGWVPINVSAVLFAPFSSAVVAFGVSVYALEGAGVVLPCEAASMHPQQVPVAAPLCGAGGPLDGPPLTAPRTQYVPILTGVIFFCVAIYCVIGAVPYIAFGALTSDQIANNVAAFAERNASTMPAWSSLVQIVRIFFAIGVLLSYPVQHFVLSSVSESVRRPPCSVVRRAALGAGQHGAAARQLLIGPGHVCGGGMQHDTTKRNALRTGLVVLSIVLATTVPRFGLLTGLVGAIGASSLQFIFPPIFYLRLRPQLPVWRRALLWLCAAFGAIGGAASAVATVEALIASF